MQTFCSAKRTSGSLIPVFRLGQHWILTWQHTKCVVGLVLLWHTPSMPRKSQSISSERGALWSQPLSLALTSITILVSNPSKTHCGKFASCNNKIRLIIEENTCICKLCYIRPIMDIFFSKSLYLIFQK